MTYWVVKWNSLKYRVHEGFEDLQHTKENPAEWTVSKGAKAGDTVFVGCSGTDAALFAKVEVLSDANLGSVKDPNMIVPDPPGKLRPMARVRLLTGRWPGITDAALRKESLDKVADFLHRQGISVKLLLHEARMVDDLLAKCPVCGHNPCKNTFFLNKTMDLYRDGCKEGVVICPQCGSEGYFEKTAPCPQCLKVGYRPPGAVCPLCRNKGYISLGIEICPLCERKGEVTPAIAATFRPKPSP